MLKGVLKGVESCVEKCVDLQVICGCVVGVEIRNRRGRCLIPDEE